MLAAGWKPAPQGASPTIRRADARLLFLVTLLANLALFLRFDAALVGALFPGFLGFVAARVRGIFFVGRSMNIDGQDGGDGGCGEEAEEVFHFVLSGRPNPFHHFNPGERLKDLNHFYSQASTSILRGQIDRGPCLEFRQIERAGSVRRAN